MRNFLARKGIARSEKLSELGYSLVPGFAGVVRALPLLGNGGGLANQRADSHFALLNEPDQFFTLRINLRGLGTYRLLFVLNPSLQSSII